MSHSSNYKVRKLCLYACMYVYVCPSHIWTSVHPIYFTLGGCIAEDQRKCSVNLSFGAIWTCGKFNNNKLRINKRRSSGGRASGLCRVQTEHVFTYIRKHVLIYVHKHVFTYVCSPWSLSTSRYRNRATAIETQIVYVCHTNL